AAHWSKCCSTTSHSALFNSSSAAISSAAATVPHSLRRSSSSVFIGILVQADHRPLHQFTYRGNTDLHDGGNLPVSETSYAQLQTFNLLRSESRERRSEPFQPLLFEQ